MSIELTHQSNCKKNTVITYSHTKEMLTVIGILLADKSISFDPREYRNEKQEDMTHSIFGRKISTKKSLAEDPQKFLVQQP